MRRATAGALLSVLALATALALAGCGRRGAPQVPGPGNFPRQYPDIAMPSGSVSAPAPSPAADTAMTEGTTPTGTAGNKATKTVKTPPPPLPPQPEFPTFRDLEKP